MKTLLLHVDATLASGVTARDLILSIICMLGAGGTVGYAIEFEGGAIQALLMEGRMNVCNLAVEAGAPVGLIGVDQSALDDLRGRPMGPEPERQRLAKNHWRGLTSDSGAAYDRIVMLQAEDVPPMVSWGTSPDMVCAVDGVVPDPADQADPQRRAGMQRALVVPGSAGRLTWCLSMSPRSAEAPFRLLSTRIVKNACWKAWTTARNACRKPRRFALSNRSAAAWSPGYSPAMRLSNVYQI